MQAGLAEIQKNIAILTRLTEPLQILDKRRKQIIATVYPRLATHNARRLAGKYCNRIPAALRNATFEEARETALLVVMKEKYGAAD
ncbi:MAG: hypothetical protein A2286_04345 [Gammaproteobacteria bacterium RIFOXYA12_FULL_61_12]|nr:MAG: hypothetical protein A2514_09515 [Gammaproteobacteria bacterium RIFOXYD12_FULL_61_37]OGT93627.1 MAG: hypothetical protein A2286_04345 [Gammaproteobacteria bacterium RIFOXYA12_FULL_61_12]